MTENTERLSAALVDRYRIERRIGEGGMATVYLAEDLKHDRKVAVKVLRPELAAVLGAERFVQEIKTTANLQHPHILPLFDSGEADGFLYYVMPFIDGETLRDKLDRETQLGIDEAVKITTEVADALDYAHRHNVIHRDIKPENILLHDGRPMVSDFGIALAVSAAAGGRMTETGLSLGTPYYMSPEQATAEKDITNRSDIYSLGSMLHEMLTGEPPHMGTTAQQIIMKIVTEEAQPVTKLRKSVPPHVAAATSKSLEKLAADRFETAAKFAEALTNPLFTVPNASGAMTAAPAGAHWKERVAVPALVVAALLLATNLVTLTRPTPADPVSRYEIDFPAEANIGRQPWARIAVSPDGSQLVYIGPEGRLFLRRREQLTPTELPGTDDAFNPFFSRDGTRVGFMSLPPGNASVRVVPVAGGPPVTIVDNEAGGPGANWGYDGFIYYDGSGVGPLRRVPETGGPSEIISTLDTLSGERQHNWPDALPNGRGVIMVVDRSGPGQQGAASEDIAVLDLATGRHTTLLRGVYAKYSVSGHLLYVTFDGFLMAVGFDQDRMELTGQPVALAEALSKRGGGGAVDLAISETGTLWYATGASSGQEREIVWVTFDGVASEVDPGWIGDFRSLALSPDGSRLAVELEGDDGRHIWVKQLDRARPSTKVTFDGLNSNPAWHPDGDRILFAQAPSYGGDLWITRSDGSAQAELLLDEEYSISQAVWSPDGQWIVSESVPPRVVRSLRVDSDSTSRQLVTPEVAETRMPVLSPNGRWLAYMSNRTGVYETYVRPFPNTGEWLQQVSNGGGWSPRWSHDGTRLFFVNGSDEMEQVEILTGDTFTTGEHRVLFPMPSNIDFDVAPDDQRFVMIRERGADRPGTMVVVENFFEELKAKVGND